VVGRQLGYMVLIVGGGGGGRKLFDSLQFAMCKLSFMSEL